jgi:hypothetical protein
LVLHRRTGAIWIAGPVAARSQLGVATADFLATPFESATGSTVRIRLGLARATGATRLRIFDVRGRMLWSVGPSLRASGEHVLFWNRRATDGVRASRGVYFIRLEAGEFRASRKFVLTHR